LEGPTTTQTYIQYLFNTLLILPLLKRQSQAVGLPLLLQFYRIHIRSRGTDNTRIRYMGGIINYLGVAFFFVVVGIVYHSVGFLVHERESGISQLIDAAVSHIHRRRCQIARLLAHHIAFLLVYLPGPLICSLILAYLAFMRTSVTVIILFHILTLFSLSSFALLISSFFSKAQLSSVFSTIFCILLAILAQVIVKSASVFSVSIFALLFPPISYVFFVIYRHIGRDKIY
jgi:ATP-binding cassette subfamily A (ABC1) protein 3